MRVADNWICGRIWLHPGNFRQCKYGRDNRREGHRICGGNYQGANAATNLSDANYDGIIDPLDVEQVEKIISGEETKLVLLDSASKIVTIKMPVEKIIPLNRNAAEALKTIKASDRIVGVSDAAIRRSLTSQNFRRFNVLDRRHHQILKSF